MIKGEIFVQCRECKIVVVRQIKEYIHVSEIPEYINKSQGVKFKDTDYGLYCYDCCKKKGF
jgi:uncharacterized C2H2 Zn-finger protein